MASNWHVCIYHVSRRETTPTLADLLLGKKRQRFSGTNQNLELLRPFGTGPLKPYPQRVLPVVLDFS